MNKSLNGQDYPIVQLTIDLFLIISVIQIQFIINVKSEIIIAWTSSPGEGNTTGGFLLRAGQIRTTCPGLDPGSNGDLIVYNYSLIKSLKILTLSVSLNLISYVPFQETHFL